MIPVTGDFVKIALRHERRLRADPAALFLLVLNEALKRLDDVRSLRKDDRKALADVIDRREKLKLSSELVVVSLFRFLKFREMLLKLARLREGGSVDPLKHLVL